MTRYREIFRLHEQGVTKIDIALSCGCSRNTVSSVLKRAREAGLSWRSVRELSDERISQLLFGERSDQPERRKRPDFERIHRELAKSGVTLSLLWHEYCGECRISGDIPFMYSQFCKLYGEYATTSKATMHIERKPGEKLEVDWAGQTMPVIDSITGTEAKAYLFVATLPCSGYTYVEAFMNQKLENWINAHINAWSFFGGVTRILVPDNLKTGVQDTSGDILTLNRTYQEMAEHYNTCVIPARVRKPKDKPNVERAVGIASTWIIAALRKQQFFSVSELNIVIREKLTEFNEKPFQKKPGNRRSAFLEEKGFLLPLPRSRYELSSWRVAVVQHNYCVAVDKMYYSVPFEHIKREVEVRMTRNIVEVFFDGCRISSHPRLHGKPGQYRIIPEHMPEAHRLYYEWDEGQLRSWAHECGPNIAEVVEGWLCDPTLKEQIYRLCSALFRLADKYSALRLDDACDRALVYTRNPSLKTIQSILKTGYDKLDKNQKQTRKSSSEHGFTRGAAYYGGKS
jgi:transposase